MSFTALPDLPLLTIFKNLPLTNQMALDIVSPRFARLQKEILHKVTQLVLFLGPSSLDRVKLQSFDHGPVPWPQSMYFLYINNEIANFLMDYLPSVSDLAIIIDGLDCSASEQVTYLLKYWSDNLTRLKLVIHFAGDPFRPGNTSRIAGTCLELLRLVNKTGYFPNLLHLTFDLDHQLFKGTSDSRSFPNLSILKQLQHFYFSSLDPAVGSRVLKSLELSHTDALESLGLGNWDEAGEVAKFACENPKLASKFTQLPRVKWINSVSCALDSTYLGRIFGLFTSLTRVKLDHFLGTLPKMLTALAPLPALESLQFALSYKTHLPLFLLNPYEELPILPTVTSLTISAFVNSHTDLDTPLWGHIFPALTELNLYHSCFNCGVCPHLLYRMSRRTHLRMLNDMEEILATFSFSCPKLERIFTSKYKRWEQYWAVTEVVGRKVLLKV